MKDWEEDIERYVLYDFQLGRRLRYTESEGKGYVTDCDDERDALPFEASKRCHILPKNVPLVLIYSSTQDWIRMAPW